MITDVTIEELIEIIAEQTIVVHQLEKKLAVKDKENTDLFLQKQSLSDEFQKKLAEIDESHKREIKELKKKKSTTQKLPRE